MTFKLALGGVLMHGRGHAVGGEHHDGALGHLVGLVDEDRAGLGQRLHDVHVVHDLVADVDGCAVLLQRALHGLDRAIDACAVSARLGEQHPLARRQPPTTELEAPGIPMLIVGGMIPRVLTRALRPLTASRRLDAMATAPYGVRLLVGAAVTAIEETRKLPQTILMYPMTVVSQLAHLVMKMQQDVADLVIKGDETLERCFRPRTSSPSGPRSTRTSTRRRGPDVTTRRRPDGERLTEGRFALFTGGEPETPSPSRPSRRRPPSACPRDRRRDSTTSR